MNTGGNQGMCKHFPEQPTPYLYLQTACVRLGMVSGLKPLSQGSQGAGGYPTYPAEIILTCKVQGESSPENSPAESKGMLISHQCCSQSPGRAPWCCQCVLPNITPGEKRKQEQGEGEGVRATSSSQGDSDLFKENIFIRVVKTREGSPVMLREELGQHLALQGHQLDHKMP